MCPFVLLVLLLSVGDARRKAGRKPERRGAAERGAPEQEQHGGAEALVRVLAEAERQLAERHGAESPPDLARLRVTELRRRCAAAGVPEDELDEAMESDAPKLAMGELLVAAGAGGGGGSAAQSVYAAGLRYAEGAAGRTAPFDEARAALLSAAALHAQEPLLYYLVYNTEPKFGMAAALESIVAPAMTLPPEELAALCASPIAMQLERTSLGQRLGKPAALQAARARVDADHFLSESKLELADRVITSIRPRLGVASGPAGAAALPPASREDFVDTKFLQFVRDQQEWLLAHAELDARLRQALQAAVTTNAEAVQVLSQKPRSPKRAQMLLSPEARAKFSLPPLDNPTFGRIVHRRPRQPLTGPALNPAVVEKADAIEQEFLSAGAPDSGAPNIVVVDDVMSESALEEIYRMCKEDTIWFDNRGGYLGANARRGFHHPVLWQVSEALKSTFPKIFGPQDNLTQYWAYNYHQLDPEERTKRDDPMEPRIGIHSDPATVNLNIWLTPDEANLDKDSGGLIVCEGPLPLCIVDTRGRSHLANPSAVACRQEDAAQRRRFALRLQRQGERHARVPHAAAGGRLSGRLPQGAVQAQPDGDVRRTTPSEPCSCFQKGL